MTKTAQALCKFFATQRHRIERIIADPSLKKNAMARPHIRFNGDTLTELPQKWAHAQNDALGYFVWLYARLVRSRRILHHEWDIETLLLFTRYFEAIEYWQDEDSGHWEEAPKVEASSIGTVLAGLRELREWTRDLDGLTGLWNFRIRARVREAFRESDLDRLIAKGEESLYRILPMECAQDQLGKLRDYDAALLFLVYPLNVVSDEMAAVIVSRTEDRLRGPIGIKRYIGDSFYCTDYETKIASLKDDPTRDFSTDLSSRNSLLATGGEAEWCLFDSIISVYYGREYERLQNAGGLGKRSEYGEHLLRRQSEYLNRAAAQVTRADPPRCEAFRCPELYYWEQGKLQTSKSTPLLWTQANLWTALEKMRASLEFGS
jgi:phosphorylase kinase alpha/beta subunit